MGAIKDYQEFVETNARQPLGRDPEYSFIGLAGETGECMEWLKKSVYRNDQRFDENHLLLELGDVLHYVTRIALEHGWGLKDLMKGNVDKLIKRGVN